MIRGPVIAIFGCIFAIAETIHFGSNFYPGSIAELICDAIAAVIVITGIIMWTIDEEAKENND